MRETRGKAVFRINLVCFLCLLCSFSLLGRAAPAGNTTLLDAAESGDRATALRLLSQHADANLAGADGTTAIMYASANDDLELVRALIKAGAKVNVKNQFGTSAINEAAIIGSAPVIDALLKAGADPNTKNPEGETPLMEAARTGKVDAAKRLLEAGADVNAREAWGGQSALMWAAAQGQAEMIKFLAVEGRGCQRTWRHSPVGTQSHYGTSSERHEQGWFYTIAVCRTGGLRRMCPKT